jgi:hypothetical protein
VAEAHGWLISRVTLSFWCRIESRAKADIRLNLGPVVGTTVPWPELAIGFAERLKAALEPLPSVIPNNQLAHFECDGDDGGVAGSASATTRPRVATARYDDFLRALRLRNAAACNCSMITWTDKERQMNSIPNPKQTNPHDVAIAALKEAYEQFGRADEQLARVDEQVSKLEQDAAPHPSDPQQAYEQFGRADEQLARVDEQVFKLEQDAAPYPSDPQTRINTFQSGVPDDRPSLGGREMRGFIGFLLAVCIGVAALVWQSPFYGDAARQIIARWAPQLVPTSSLTLESPGLPAQPSPPTVQSAAAKTAPPQPAHLAQTAPEDVATTAAALSPESAQQLQSMARDLATVGQEIEQLKTSQAQMVRANAELAEQLKAAQAQMDRDNAELAKQLKAAQAQMVRANAELAEQLKASQEQMARPVAKASEQNLRPRIPAPLPRPTATPARKPVPKPSSPQATAQPRAEPVSRPLTPLR